MITHYGHWSGFHPHEAAGAEMQGEQSNSDEFRTFCHLLVCVLFTGALSLRPLGTWEFPFDCIHSYVRTPKSSAQGGHCHGSVPRHSHTEHHQRPHRMSPPRSAVTRTVPSAAGDRIVCPRYRRPEQSGCPSSESLVCSLSET
jgi:hypothetical protein